MNNINKNHKRMTLTKTYKTNNRITLPKISKTKNRITLLKNKKTNNWINNPILSFTLTGPRKNSKDLKVLSRIWPFKRIKTTFTPRI